MLLSRYSTRSADPVLWDNSNEWGTDMRVFLAIAIIISAAIGMGGCFWHHQQAVQTQPLK
jgi:hypothetical protein